MADKTSWKQLAETSKKALSSARNGLRSAKETAAAARKAPVGRMMVDGFEAMVGGAAGSVADEMLEGLSMGPLRPSVVVGGAALWYSCSEIARKAESGEEAGMELDIHSASLGMLGGAGRAMADEMADSITSLMK